MRFWLANIGPKEAAKGGGKQGILALYKVCVHLGCLYAWVDSTVRFECPCHGSKYHLDGTYIEGPAPRDLDRFKVTLVGADGKPISETSAAAGTPDYGAPIPVPSDTNVVIKVDTGTNLNLGKRYYYRGGPAT